MKLERRKMEGRLCVSTLWSLWDKGKKTVILLSIMLGRQLNLGEHDGKGEIVKFYNATKSDVDTFDKDVSFLMRQKTTDCDDSHLEWRKELVYQLTLLFVHRRLLLQGLLLMIKIAMNMVGVDTCGNDASDLARSKGRCSACPRKRDRKPK